LRGPFSKFTPFTSMILSFSMSRPAHEMNSSHDRTSRPHVTRHGHMAYVTRSHAHTPRGHNSRHAARVPFHMFVVSCDALGDVRYDTQGKWGVDELAGTPRLAPHGSLIRSIYTNAVCKIAASRRPRKSNSMGERRMPHVRYTGAGAGGRAAVMYHRSRKASQNRGCARGRGACGRYREEHQPSRWATPPPVIDEM
jgi:hypothetical protein